MILQNVHVRLAGVEEKDAWDKYVMSHEYSVAYHLFAWKESIEKVYRLECPYFFAEKQGRVCGILPAVHIHSPLSRSQLVSLPYCDAGGISADNTEISEVLFDYACQYAAENRISKLEFRHTPNADAYHASWGNKKDYKKPSNRQSPNSEDTGKVRMLLALPESAETLLASFKSKLRSQIKKPVREGLFFRLGGSDLLPHFYPVFAENMRNLGSPVHSKNWLGSVLENYGENAKCGVVYMADGRPAAGGIMLCHNRIVSIPWASSLPQLNHHNPNMLLYWSFLEYAADNGYPYFDFGRSTPGGGTYKFKAQWGAKPQQLFWERWKVLGGTIFREKTEAVSKTNGRARVVAEKIIQKMPLLAATFLGSRIRKYISL